ncbi:F-box protein [Hibiscus syriacus]|uniref:F-box protein n=1 Tax=Hibiscus syriacus TaxID=106335 RepID=A0A6A2XFQ2_HIBSY|nr:F-box protein At3g58530 [Hibiscus syriacus]KAE8674292.1 F-box protein [Hibiscus syriacus]
MEGEEQRSIWNKETVPKVMKIVITRLSQTDIISLLLVSPWLHRTVISHPSLWLSIDLREMNNAGDRLIAALSLPRYQHVKQISLEFAQDIDDGHLEVIKSKCSESLQDLESLNLNGCQKISDEGIEYITSCCPKLKVFSIYWNVRVTDIGVKHLVKNCKYIVDLNFSGCKQLSDKSLQLVADNYQELESLNLTRCVKMTDSGLQQVLTKCFFLQSLNLYALSSFTDEAYKKISVLSHLRFLDLCGAQNLSDYGLTCIAQCKKLSSLNLTWCIRVTDVGVIAIAEGCTSLEFLSLFGIIGVTDKCLEALSKSCANTITTLDVNGCIGIKRRSRDDLLKLFPYLRCFKVHS